MWIQTGSRQAEGLPDISRWLRSEATTPPDYDQRNRKHPEGMQDFGPCRDGRVHTIFYLPSLQDRMDRGALTFRGCRFAQPAATFLNPFGILQVYADVNLLLI